MTVSAFMFSCITRFGFKDRSFGGEAEKHTGTLLALLSSKAAVPSKTKRRDGPEGLTPCQTKLFLDNFGKTMDHLAAIARHNIFGNSLWEKPNGNEKLNSLKSIDIEGFCVPAKTVSFLSFRVLLLSEKKMRGFLYVATFATLCVLGTAALTASSSCTRATLLKTAEIPAGDITLNYAQFQCNPATTLVASADISVDLSLNSILCILLGIDCPPPPPHIPPPPPPAPKNECGASCSISCNNNTAGTLPPIADDCQSIVNSFTIFQQQLSTFTVQPGHMETLSFGTCNIFFQNFGSEPLEYCWSDLGTVATNDGNACFPPNAFSFGEGLCTGYDGLWAVGESHS